MSLETLNKSIESCRKCNLSKKCMPLSGHNILKKPRIGIVLSNPSKEATEQGNSLEGVIGQYIKDVCRKADIEENEIFVSYLVHCSIYNNSEPTKPYIDTCSPWLDEQIELCKPKVLIGCGKETIRHLLNISKKTIPLKDYIGNEYPYGNFHTKIIPAYSMQYCLRRGWPTQQEMLRIFRKAKEVSF